MEMGTRLVFQSLGRLDTRRGMRGARSMLLQAATVARGVRGEIWRGMARCRKPQGQQNRQE